AGGPPTISCCAVAEAFQPRSPWAEDSPSSARGIPRRHPASGEFIRGPGRVTQPVSSDAECVTLPRMRDRARSARGGAAMDGATLIAYYRVSTQKQGASGLGLEG